MTKPAEILLRIDDSDDNVCTLDEFLTANFEGLSEDDLEAVACLDVGEVLTLGGGAAAESKIERVEQCPNDCEDGVSYTQLDVDDFREGPCSVCMRIDADEDGPYCVRNRKYVSR
jgi:hypothetical protein